MVDERPAAKRHVGLLRRMAACALLGVGAVGLAPSCLERRAEPIEETNAARCATCHGDPGRAGDFLSRAAPPRDLFGASGVGYPGVGAHALHLRAGKAHGAISCSECHIVPTRSDSPGHADDARPAELVFGPLAKTGGLDPSYDAARRSCSNSWCHGKQSDAVWTQPRTSEVACGSCHGLPPASPHPQSARCETCHGDVVDAARAFVAPALHVDGIVQSSVADCSACHGRGADPAPPQDTLGNASPSAIGVGAHRVHLAGGAFSRPLACSECHRVPDASDSVGHPQGLPAQVLLVGVAERGDHRPSWDRSKAGCADTWCHGPSPGQHDASPSWVKAQPLGCTSCHGSPPPAPHPQLADCNACHAAVVGPDNLGIVDRLRHVDGVVDVAFEASCTSCHGGKNSAPPRDLDRHDATTFAGVGAHQAHLGENSWSRPVPCTECHVVPEQTFSAGHLDSALPAEVEFSGAATAFGAVPKYTGGSCVQTACHGGKFPGTHRSGGTNVSPRWTTVDGTQATCGSCHALPPPPPHPYASNCSQCHENMAADNATFVRPELHVDGVVTFTVP